MLMQMLPHALKAQGRSAVAVFCDFRKAYDTVDRTFLWKGWGAPSCASQRRCSATRARAPM